MTVYLFILTSNLFNINIIYYIVVEERKKLEGLKEKIVDQQDRLSIEEQNLNSMDNELANHNKLLVNFA